MEATNRSIAITAFISASSLYAFGMTLEKNSRWRYIIAFLIIPICYTCLVYATYVSNLMNASGAIGAFATNILLLSQNYLWIRPYQMDAGSALQILYSPRYLGTDLQVKHIPPFPRYFGEDGKKPPGRFAYIIRTSALVVWCLIVIDIIRILNGFQTSAERQEAVGNAWDFSLNLKQWSGRIMVTVTTWFIVNPIVINFHGLLFNLICVTLGIASTKHCQPLFDRSLSAYSVRRFWGKQYHQLLRPILTSCATSVTQNLLHLTKPSLVDRYSNIFLAFTFSGLIHILLNFSLRGWDLNPIGTMIFFQSGSIGIMIEDAVEALWIRRFGKSEGSSPPVWQKVVGIIWLISWLTIFTPLFIYPISLLPLEYRLILPFTFEHSIGLQSLSIIAGILGLINFFVFKAEL